MPRLLWGAQPIQHLGTQTLLNFSKQVQDYVPLTLWNAFQQWQANCTRNDSFGFHMLNKDRCGTRGLDAEQGKTSVIALERSLCAGSIKRETSLGESHKSLPRLLGYRKCPTVDGLLSRRGPLESRRWRKVSANACSPLPTGGIRLSAHSLCLDTLPADKLLTAGMIWIWI